MLIIRSKSMLSMMPLTHDLILTKETALVEHLIQKCSFP